MSGRKKRELSHEERHLWAKVTKTISPRVRSARTELQDTIADSAQSDTDVGTPKAKHKAPFLSPYIPPSISTNKQGPPSHLDMKTRKRLKRGQDRLDATIDLHGLTQDTAHRRLIQFLRQAQLSGARYVLVITGKGKSPHPDTGQKGILRQAVPQWLSGPELAPIVVGYDTAHLHHGGSGALYVRLRRKDRMSEIRWSSLR